MKKFISTFSITFLLIYACAIMIKQEASLVDLRQKINECNNEYAEKQFVNEQLTERLAEPFDIFVEKEARRQGFVYPNEIIYVNANS